MAPSGDRRYLTVTEVVALHQLVMERTGASATPMRDRGALESAVMRPQMIAFYEQADLIRECAALGVGIAQAQAFIDGNKRTAYAAADTFLRLNGMAFAGDPVELGRQLEGVAERTGTLEEATARFEGWLRENVRPLAELRS